MKIFSIIKTLNKKQRLDFLTYITLYHKPESEVYKTASWINLKSDRRTVRELSYSIDEIIFELPFKIKSQSLSNALTTLGNLAEEFIGWMVWKGSSNLKATCQLTALAQKSLSGQYIKTQKNIFDESENKMISIWDDHYKMLSIFNDYYFRISDAEDNHTELFNRLITTFKKSTSTVAQFLMVEIMNREKLLSEPWDKHKVFFDVLYQNDTALGHITDRIIKMNYKKDETAYDYLINILYSSEIDNLSLYIKYCISTYCILYLLGSIKDGAVSRGQELLDLYEFSLEKEIFSLNDTMPLNRYINIIGVASKFKKYTWARKVVNNWAHKVDKYNYKTISVFGHAIIDFHQKKYENVVVELSQMKTSNFIHRLNSRWLLLKAQYEINKNHVEIIKIQIDNFRRFLIANESRIKKSTFEGHKKSVKILNKLLDRKDYDHVIEYYNTSKYIFERKWILEKIKNPM